MALIVVSSVAFCLWVPQLWNQSRDTEFNELDEILGSPSISPEPSRSSSTVSAAFSKLDLHCSSLLARIFVFLIVTVTVGACSWVDLVSNLKLDFLFFIYSILCDQQGIVLNTYNSTLELDSQNDTLTSQCDFYDPRIYLWVIFD